MIIIIANLDKSKEFTTFVADFLMHNGLFRDNRHNYRAHLPLARISRKHLLVGGKCGDAYCVYIRFL